MAPSRAAKPAATRRSARQAGLEPGQTHKVIKPTPKGKSKKAARPPPVKYECVVCYKETTGHAFPDYLCSENCKHLINTCKDCLKAHINAQLEMKMYDQISCSQCAESMGEDCIMRYGGKDAGARFRKLKRKGIAEQNPGWFWCLNPKCQGGHVHESLTPKEGEDTTSIIDLTGDDSDKIFTCTECEVKSCVDCQRLWHDDVTCAEVKLRNREEEAASLATIAKECKPCPKCKKQIEKNGGCDAVYCTQCRTQFCWRCATAYDTIQAAGRHGEGCLYNMPDRIDPHHWPPAPPLNGAGDLIQPGLHAVQAAMARLNNLL